MRPEGRIGSVSGREGRLGSVLGREGRLGSGLGLLSSLEDILKKFFRREISMAEASAV